MVGDNASKKPYQFFSPTSALPCADDAQAGPAAHGAAQVSASLPSQNHRHLQAGLQGTQVAVALVSALRLA